MPTQCDLLIRHVLRDEALTRGLGDIEARMLVEWLADWTELLADAARTEDDAWSCVDRLCRRGRAIGKFVRLWNEPFARGSAIQLAASERFDWPLPATDMDPGDLMHHILTWRISTPARDRPRKMGFRPAQRAWEVAETSGIPFRAGGTGFQTGVPFNV